MDGMALEKHSPVVISVCVVFFVGGKAASKTSFNQYTSGASAKSEFVKSICSNHWFFTLNECMLFWWQERVHTRVQNFSVNFVCGGEKLFWNDDDLLCTMIISKPAINAPLQQVLLRRNSVK